MKIGEYLVGKVLINYTIVEYYEPAQRMTLKEDGGNTIGVTLTELIDALKSTPSPLKDAMVKEYPEYFI